MTTPDLPPNLPPLPPVPEGFDRWEYRGMGWEKPTARTFAVSYAPDYRNWKVVANKEPQGANWCHYLEAVREPAKDQPASGTRSLRGTAQPCRHRSAAATIQHHDNS
jgi:hypothetical protein